MVQQARLLLIYLISAFQFISFLQEMESELERFHKQNTQLELNITELRQKLKATDKELHHERQRVCHNHTNNAIIFDIRPTLLFIHYVFFMIFFLGP